MLPAGWLFSELDAEPSEVDNLVFDVVDNTCAEIVEKWNPDSKEQTDAAAKMLRTLADGISQHTRYTCSG